MKKTMMTASLVALMGTSAAAQDIGATFSRFDDNWLTVLRNGMVEYAATIDGLNYQQEDATDDLAKQIDQVKNFVASGVDAIIVNIVDTSAGAAITAAAGDTPLVFVNREPAPDRDPSKLRRFGQDRQSQNQPSPVQYFALTEGSKQLT